ncbi:aromatic ring-opening dioxygenase LigA [Xylanimonas protaetiae]|uniref:Aromatic ring-opening dioxygenase LigA n=1 Tax=Xylanimonas protaetiae TaxID=2509457 RepID=A0A4P6F5Y6_9MICO|nr:aromatic ring-opening dioxygenase LigA [Xylanimonas protaetiae]QAY71142.1 aromatic ring-opening dioxygenase LigA [Xylanimonas protaetiae]
MSNKTVRVSGLIGLIAGILMVVVGGTVWGFAANQLGAQQITVPASANFLAGSSVNNPFSALAQADIIGVHQQTGAVATLEENADLLASIGITVDPDATYNFATLGPINTAVNGAVAEGTITAEEAAPILALRDTANQASGLQAALFTSVIAFGVAALIIGLGILSAINGFAMTRVAGRAGAKVAEKELVNA